MKTNLQKILSISGESGLFTFVSQAKNGIIAESVQTKKRSAFGVNARVTSLSDVSIYTDDMDEISLKEVFKKMHAHLGEKPAPSHKSDKKVIVDFFNEAIPNYDRDRFYISHMKKVLQWYNIISEYLSFDFLEPEDKEEKKEEETKKEA
ncbi:MAG: DUF5606 domain-containing protein [Bacteroidales bacterium]